MVTLIIVFFIIILAMIHGYKKGLTKELSSLISWAVTLFVMTLVIMLYTSFSASEGKNMILTVVMLVITGVVYSIIKFTLIQPILTSLVYQFTVIYPKRI